MQLPQIDKYTPNCAHEIWVRWSKVAFISYVWFTKRIGSPVIRGKANKKEARRKVERFDRSILALTRCSKKSSFFDSSQFKSSESPLTKKHFSLGHGKIVVTSYLLATYIVWWTNRFTKPNFSGCRDHQQDQITVLWFHLFCRFSSRWWLLLMWSGPVERHNWVRVMAINCKLAARRDGPTNRLATKDRPAQPLFWCNSPILDRPPGFRMCRNFFF